MESQLLELIGLIYDAAQDSARWPDFLRRYGEVLNFHAAQLEFFTPDASVGASFGMAAADIQEFTKFASINPWRPLIQRATPGEVGLSHELVPDSDYRKGTISRGRKEDRSVLRSSRFGYAVIFHAGSHRSNSQ